MFHKMIRVIASKNPYRFRALPDKMYLQIRYIDKFGKKIKFRSPITFNEKLQWLKIYDRNPRYINIVDKYRAREWIKETIGEEYLVKLLGVWERVEDIDFDSLPDRFVLKTTHDSGGVCVCKDKNHFDIRKAKIKLDESLKHNYYYSGREWPYKNIKPRIICEEFIDDNGHSPDDYKILCFNGRPDNVMVCFDRESGTTKYYFFDMNWNLMRCNGWGKNATQGFTLPKPENFDRMIEIAKRLSTDIPLARVDLYNVDGKIYFGEVTLYPDSGFDANYLSETDKYFGDLIDLSGAYKYKK